MGKHDNNKLVVASCTLSGMFFFFTFSGMIIPEAKKGSAFRNVILHSGLTILKGKRRVQQGTGKCKKQ